MLEFRQKNKFKRILYSPITLIFLFVLFLVLLKAVWGVYIKEKTSAENLVRQNTELNKLISREKELAQAVEFLKTEEGVEAEIRSKFRAVKEGESVAVIIDNESPRAVKAATSTPPGFWKKVLKFFGFI